VTAELRQLCHHWRPTAGLSDEQLAAQVRSDGIDLLVDLAGHTAGNRLLTFARRPAPVLVSYLGYPGTTGLEAIGYRLADTVTDPPEEPAFYAEELVRLPGAFCCYAPPAALPPPGAAPPSRTSGLVTFGSLHKLEKLNERVVDLWCQVLQAVPGSRLLLCRHTLDGTTAAWWVRQVAARGLAPRRLVPRRVEAVGMAHLAAYADIDVALDPFPWNGHATACEALWMGVPVVALRGPRHASRMVASVLTAVGLTELIAETPEEYCRLAVALAADEAQRAELRRTLRERLQTSPLCDGATFTRGLEAAYRQLWRRWCAGQRGGQAHRTPAAPAGPPGP
jgi:predicted O-linked N-acetylglucosamine transferase (SPINDLY family)